MQQEGTINGRVMLIFMAVVVVAVRITEEEGESSRDEGRALLT
jgi:hypothetical protein